MKAAKRIGRPPKPAEAGKRVSLGLKVTSDIKQRLDATARVSGRTQSQEAELRLEQSFRNQALLSEVLTLAYGNEVGAILREIGWVMRETGPTAGFLSKGTIEGARDWISNPFAFHQAAQAVATVIERRRPAGDLTPPAAIGHSLIDEVHKNLGVFSANTLLNVIDGRDGSDGSDAPPTARLADEAAEIRKLRGGNRHG